MKWSGGLRNSEERCLSQSGLMAITEGVIVDPGICADMKQPVEGRKKTGKSNAEFLSASILPAF